MSTNLSKLADELKPYIVPWVRKIAQGGERRHGTPSDSVSNVQTAILKATNGALSIDS
jgi:hypothetical protein